MIRQAVAAGAMILSAACGTDDGRTTIELKPLDGNPTGALAYRDAGGDGAWHTLVDGELSFEVVGPAYAVFERCTFADVHGVPTPYTSNRMERTTADATTVTLPCSDVSALEGPQSEVIGTLSGGGEIHVPGESEPTFGDGGGMFDVSVRRAAATPFIAIVGDSAIVRRDLDTSGAETDLGFLDVVGAGVKLEPKRLDLDGVDPSGTTSTQLQFVLGEQAVGVPTWSAPGAVLPDTNVLPDEALGAGDHQHWYTEAAFEEPRADGPTLFRNGVDLDWRSTLDPHQTLLAPARGATFARTTASWGAYADLDTLDVMAFELHDFAHELERQAVVFATASAMAGAATLDVDMSGTPGYDAAYVPDPAGAAYVLTGKHYLDAAGASSQYVVVDREPVAH